MGSSAVAELPTEWWDSLAEGEPVLGESPARPTIQSWTWADQQADDCFTLGPLCFSEEEMSVAEHTAQLPDLITGKLEDLFLVPALLDCAVRSPVGAALKPSIDDSTSSPRLPPRSISPLTPGHSDGSSSLTRAFSGVVVDLQVSADHQSDSVTCTITSSTSDVRRAQADSYKGSSGGLTNPAKVLLFEANTIESTPASSRHEDDNSTPGLPMEVDLQCKGEQLGLEGEEDSAVDIQPGWNPSSCMGFIPVTQAVLPETSSQSTDPLSQRMEEGTTSNEDSRATEGGLSTCQEAVKTAGSLPLEMSPVGDDAEESPAASMRDSAQSDGTFTVSGLEGKRRISKPGKLVEAASVNDMAAAVGGRRRCNRPSKASASAGETQAVGGKRKRPQTCKPAPPIISGHACTQCFTHVTPVWRAGPEGPKTLCNACGVRYMKVAKRK